MVARKLASSFLALTFSLAAIVTPTPASAAGVVGSGTPASCTEVALTTALNGGGTITFNCGTAAHTIPITSTKYIQGTTTIDGGGLISLSGGNTSTVISVADGITLNLANITIKDTGSVPFTGGQTMLNSGTANLTNTTFLNNNRLAIRNGAGTLTISGSRFENNTSSGYGGAISNENGSTLTVHDTTFVNNRAPQTGYYGGAIYNSAPPNKVDIIRSTFTGNSAEYGGAVANFGIMNINDSTFNNNSADEGGALYASSQSQLNISNTTISGNTAMQRGGGILAAGPLPTTAATLTNVTLANNTAPATAPNFGGSNISLNGEVSITLRNTIIAQDSTTSDNCVDASTGALVDGGGNLQYPGTTCGAAITSANPQLGSLANNGGFTLTHALGINSLARETANKDVCTATDQRGVIRPQGTSCDIGAVEYGAVPVLRSISPRCGIRNGKAFTLTVDGTNFIAGINGSRVVVNGTAMATTFVSPTRLTVTIPAGYVTSAPGSTIPVAVQTPVVDGGTSVQQQLTVCHTIYMPFAVK